MALSLQRYTWSRETHRFTQILKQRSKKGKKRSMLIAIEKIDHLPENLIFEILSRLSVKDLLQFKSVQIMAGELNLYELLVNETPRVLADAVLYEIPRYNSYICGPCDGLYYLYEYDSSCRALWNPAINEFKTLPKIICKPDLPAKFTYAANEVYGFGFDHVSGDYKVVVMKGYWNANSDSDSDNANSDSDNDNANDDSDLKHPVSVLVYSLKTDSWRYCGDLAKAYHLEDNKCYIYVNGCCYWFGSLDNYGVIISEVIISFDMENDSFKEIDVPDYAQPSSKRLAVYDDSLAFLSLHEIQKNFDIWTWSDGCWTKKFSVGPLRDVRSPVGHWKGNMLLLLRRGGKLVLFDPNTKETKDLGFQTHTSCEGVFAYMESLVSIKDRVQGRAAA